jgi:hypothetical protein
MTNVPRSGRVAGAGADRWCLYAAGYKRAAELLIQQVRTTYEANTLIFPIIFLYRHYVEVTLKEIIEYGVTWMRSAKPAGVTCEGLVARGEGPSSTACPRRPES